MATVTVMFGSTDELAKFYAAPQDVRYIGEPMKLLNDSYILRFVIDGVTSREAIERRVRHAGGVITNG